MQYNIGDRVMLLDRGPYEEEVWKNTHSKDNPYIKERVEWNPLNVPGTVIKTDLSSGREIVYVKWDVHGTENSYMPEVCKLSKI